MSQVACADSRPEVSLDSWDYIATLLLSWDDKVDGPTNPLRSQAMWPVDAEEQITSN